MKLTRLGRLDLSDSISKTLPLSEAPAAEEQLQEKVGNPVRIVLQP